MAVFTYKVGLRHRLRLSLRLKLIMKLKMTLNLKVAFLLGMRFRKKSTFNFMLTLWFKMITSFAYRLIALVTIDGTDIVVVVDTVFVVDVGVVVLVVTVDSVDVQVVVGVVRLLRGNEEPMNAFLLFLNVIAHVIFKCIFLRCPHCLVIHGSQQAHHHLRVMVKSLIEPFDLIDTQMLVVFSLFLCTALLLFYLDMYVFAVLRDSSSLKVGI